jgi:hypothetical protein
MAKTATDTGNKITSGYALIVDGIEEYFETLDGAVQWSKQGGVNSVSFYTDKLISDEDKADDLLYGLAMTYSDNL